MITGPDERRIPKKGPEPCLPALLPGGRAVSCLMKRLESCN